MKVIVRPRQCEKSTDIIKYAHLYGSHILTPSHNECDRLHDESKRIGYPIERDRFISAKDVNYGNLKGIHITSLVVDDVDIVLENMLEIVAKIKCISITGIPEFEYDEREDSKQYVEFSKYNPDLTFQEFSKFKYNL